MTRTPADPSNTDALAGSPAVAPPVRARQKPPISSNPPISDPPDPNRRLGRVLGWVAAFAFIAAGLALIASILYSSWILLAGSLLSLLVGVSLLTAGSYMAKGREERGALMLTIAIFSGATGYILVLPGAMLTLALLPVIVTAIVLPMVRGAALMRILVATWALGFVLVVTNLLWDPPVRFPDWFTLTLRATAFAVVLAITLSMLLHLHRRLNTSVEQARSDAQALQTAHDQLKQNDQAKTRFLNSAAHELRTPLTPVLIQLELMRKNQNVEKDDQLKHSIQLINRNVLRLKDHVDDLLEIARLQSSTLHNRITPTRLDPILQDVEDTFKDLAESERIHLEVETHPLVRVQADGPRIIQVLFNLVSNAIKATPPGGRIRVETETEAGQCTVHVRDTGKGIPEDEIGRLFQPFGQLPSDEGDGEGVGLGLYICRSVIEAHGGRIGVTSKGPGQGADFYFTLPLVPVKKTKPQEHSAHAHRPETPIRWSTRRSPRSPATQTP